MSKSSPVEAFRTRFIADRRDFARSHGAEAFDQGQVLYASAAGDHHVVVRDQFYGARPSGPFPLFLQRLTQGWWATRSTLEQEDGQPLHAVAGLYAHYLPEMGFDCLVELGAHGPTHLWRVDARARATRLPIPADEGEFRDLLGTFFDLRAGWGWLFDRHLEREVLSAVEVQAGYLVGVRRGVPGDPTPAEREDPELAEAFSRWDPQRYDTLEFLAGEVSEKYPFHGERYREWLGETRVAAVDAGAVDLFVVADSSEFLATIEDLCARHGVAVEWIDPDEDLRVALHHGDLRVEVGFAYPYLRTLHTGRTFADGVRSFYLPLVEALEEAHDLLEMAREHISGHELTIQDGAVLVARAPGETVPVGRWNLMALGGRNFRGSAGVAALLELLGYDPDQGRFIEQEVQLDVCPVCGEHARVNKVVRPQELLGVDPRTLAGVPIGEHIVYYTLDCTLHSTPLEPGPERDLHALETAYREGLERARLTLLEARELEGATLLVGFDIGSFVLEPARLKAALLAADHPAEGEVSAYAFFPDALLVADEPLRGPALQRARLAALETVQARFPARTWSLDVARPVDLDVEPLGTVELAG